MADEQIEAVRQRIDALDAQLLQLVNERARLAQEIGHLKQGPTMHRCTGPSGGDDHQRLQQANPGPLPGGAVRAIWRELMSACRGLERPLRVAFLGPWGTFSEAAMRQRFGDAVEGVPVRRSTMCSG